MSSDINNGYAKVQYKYVWRDGKAMWEPIYQNANVKVEPTSEDANVEESTYAELSFTSLPTQGKNGPSTNEKKHTYAKLINVEMMRRPLPPVPVETDAEEHTYATIAPEILPSEKKVQRMKSILESIKDFFVNLFKSKKIAPDYGLQANEHWIAAVASADYELRTNEHWCAAIAHSTMSSPDEDAAKSLKSRPNSKVKELNVAQDTIVMSTYC
ncbi:Hypothetical protein CINCED_3A000848 [Cinara cedri]|uniref:Uncharacterized protein n=1 Tax=Cinara cedri TaxID=506608 RepID=A0A5E4MNM7_9HEMI|nr:Hypothetical protein CINCED_3A000848 [Cinara cedri]